RLEASRRMLESRGEVFTLQLKALTVWPSGEPLGVAGSLDELPRPLDRSAGIAPAPQHPTDPRGAPAEAAPAPGQVAEEQAEGRWDASINVNYQRQDFGFSGLSGITDRGGTRQIQDIFHYFGGNVTITLPVRNQNQGNVAAARAETAAAERRVELAV